jgi:intein/homing endonuclease
MFATCESDLELLKYIHEKHDHKKDGDKKPTFFVYSTTLAQVVKLSDLIDKHFSPVEGKPLTTIETLDYILTRPFHQTNSAFETYIFLDCDAYINDRQIQRKIKDILSRYQLNADFTINLLMLSQTVCVPPSLERLSEVVFFDLPDEEKLREFSAHLAEKLKLKPKDLPTEETLINCKGLTLFETEQAFLQSIKLHKAGLVPNKIDLDFIRNFKKSSIAKTDLLSLMESNVSFEDIGGMDTLKKWIVKSAGGWTVEGRKFGLPLLKGLLLIGLPGTGKAQPLDSIVFTPGGPKTMGEMKVGDKILTPGGGSAKVIKIFPQGLVDAYKITFEDGASVECTADHLWQVHIRDRRHVADTWIVPTSFLMDKVVGSYDKKNNIYIDVPTMARIEMKKLPVDPYALGALIGDGSFLFNRVSFTSMDHQIVNKLEKCVQKKNCSLNHIVGRHGKAKQYSVARTCKKRINKFVQEIEKLGLMGKGSHEKFIPKNYLYASHEQRIKLLHGLMDTDGSVCGSGSGTIEYSTSSKQLAQDFKILVESLGGLCFITERETYYKKNGIKIPCRKSYRCFIRININPFSLERKKKKVIERTKYAKIRRVITSIEHIGKKSCQCIAINNLQNLYMTNNYVVTHNSLVCKAVGNQWHLPVISLDPSRVFSSRVGESEQNIRRVLTIVENVAPCLVGETRITLADGQVSSIKELYENQYRGKVLSIGKNFENATSNVTLITKKTSDDVFNIRTQIGNIKATGNHKFPILKSDGELHWVETQNLVRGDYVVCPRQVKTEKPFNLMGYVDEDTRFYSEKFNTEMIEILKAKDPIYYAKVGRRIRGSHKNKSETSPEYGKGRSGYVLKHELVKYGINMSDMSHVTKVARGGGGYQDSSISKFPAAVDETLFYILGLLWSDGNIGDRSYWHYDLALKDGQRTEKYRQRNINTSKFFGNEIILHKKITDYIGSTFGVNFTTFQPKESRLWITYGLPTILGEILRKIQKDILTLDEKYQWAWLSGVLDGDGHIHKQRVNYAATKHMNNEYIRDIFLRVGIPTTSCKDDFKNINIEITSNKFIKKAAQNLKVFYPKKINGLIKLAEEKTDTKCRMDTLDVRELLISLLIKKDLIASTDIDTGHDGVCRNQTGFTGLTPEINHIIHEYLERKRNIDIDKLRLVFQAINESPWFLQDNVYFSPIEEVSKIHGEFDVYDLCLDKNHNFIANRMFTHNCVLFIDEIEKGFAGSQSSTFSDSGVTARIIGTFLTWLQDCTKPVFTVATSNNIAYLPPELIQRFDEKFFVNLPQIAEREDIFKIHLKKLSRDPKDFDIKKLAEESQDLSGREIEQVLKESMYDAFSKKSEDKNSDLSTEFILNVLHKKTNLLLTMNEQLKYLLKWVGFDKDKKDGVRARFAHPIEENDITRVKDQIESLISEVEKGGGGEAGSQFGGGPNVGGPLSGPGGGCF